MKRFKFTYDKDAEEQWVNALCQEGWALRSFFAGICEFTPCEKGEYIYRIDLLPGKGITCADDAEDYYSFMEETGVEIVQRWGRWVYLRKKTADGPFELYTDTESELALYQRIRKMFFSFLILEVCCSLTVWPSLLLHPSSFHGILAAFYIAVFVLALRAILRCTRKIEELRRKSAA